MAHYHRKKGWELPDSAATDHGTYLNRRQLLKAMGITGIAAAGLTKAGCGLEFEGNFPIVGNEDNPYHVYFPTTRNEAFEVTERALTDPEIATTYNNFYEFTTVKDQVWTLVGAYEIEPWTVEVIGECNNPRTFGIEDLLAMEMEERIYRHRCVEAWAMTVPWSGFPLSRLLDLVEPTSRAQYVRFVSENRPDEQPGVIERPDYAWPYYEALRMDEAMNDLCFLTMGLYGEAIARQNGAPVRLTVPWKYGFKSIKSIITIELTEDRPPTFWNDRNDNEYSWLSNVDPSVPHPRWSQETEWLIGTDGERVDTMLYNGYGEWVADLYS